MNKLLKLSTILNEMPSTKDLGHDRFFPFSMNTDVRIIYLVCCWLNIMLIFTVILKNIYYFTNFYKYCYGHQNSRSTANAIKNILV